LDGKKVVDGRVVVRIGLALVSHEAKDKPIRTANSHVAVHVKGADTVIWGFNRLWCAVADAGQSRRCCHWRDGRFGDVNGRCCRPKWCGRKSPRGHRRWRHNWCRCYRRPGWRQGDDCWNGGGRIHWCCHPQKDGDGGNGRCRLGRPVADTSQRWQVVNKADGAATQRGRQQQAAKKEERCMLPHALLSHDMDSHRLLLPFSVDEQR